MKNEENLFSQNTTFEIFQKFTYVVKSTFGVIV